MSEDAGIEAAVRDYFEGWYDADVERMERALHPDLAKRAPANGTLDETTAAWMIEATAEGRGRRTDPAQRELEVEIVDVHDAIATVVVRSPIYREYVHLARLDDGWRIVNTLWTPTRATSDPKGDSDG